MCDVSEYRVSDKWKFENDAISAVVVVCASERKTWCSSSFVATGLDELTSLVCTMFGAWSSKPDCSGRSVTSLLGGQKPARLHHFIRDDATRGHGVHHARNLPLSVTFFTEARISMFWSICRGCQMLLARCIVATAWAATDLQFIQSHFGTSSSIRLTWLRPSSRLRDFQGFQQHVWRHLEPTPLLTDALPDG